MKTIMFCISLAILLLLVTGAVVGSDRSNSSGKSGEEINWQVISSGGTDGTSTNFQLSGTTAQTAVGYGSSTNFGLNHGYWQNFDTTGSGPCDCEPGEMNADAAINIFDVTGIISYLYLGGSPPIPYEICNGDMNADCTVNIFDVTGLISFLYLSGTPPVSCEDWITACGPPLRK